MAPRRMGWTILGGILAAGCGLFLGLDEVSYSPGTDAGLVREDAATGGDAALGADSAAGVHPYVREVRADDPVGYWRLDELSGTRASDSSGNGKDGTYELGCGLGQRGALGDAGAAVRFADGGLVSIVGTSFVFAGKQPFSV